MAADKIPMTREGAEAIKRQLKHLKSVERPKNVHDIAVCNFCVFHERFREEIAKNVTVAGNPLACFLLATRGWSGETKISSKNVVQVNINEDHVRALLRNYECVYALVLRGARLKEER